MNHNLVLVFIFSQLLVDVLSLKSNKRSEIERSKSKIANWSPLAKLCFKCDPGTVSTPECMIRGNESDPPNPNNTCAVGYCTGGASNCSVCPAGTFSDGVNRFGLSECTNCSGGYYSTQNRSTSCNECEARFYCPFPRNVEQISCPVGAFCNQSGLSDFYFCPPGFYCPTIELKEPVQCPAGSFCEGTTKPPQPCPENTRCPAGTAYPIDCPSLFISDKMSAVCSPTIAFWVIVAISMSSILIFFGWLFFKISNMAMAEQEEIKSAEITKIIPPANGPKYTGL